MRLQITDSIQSENSFSRERCGGRLASLFSLFQKAAPVSSDSSGSLSPRKITIGGVENVGNSCIFSVLLQEFAALPALYDALLLTPLVQGETESSDRFKARQDLQRSLYASVQKIRNSKTVGSCEIRHLVATLQSLGWEGKLPSFWQRLLHRIFPSLFPLPFFGAHKLYDDVLGLLLETFPTCLPLSLDSKENNRDFPSFFEKRECRKNMLWKVALNGFAPPLEEQFAIGEVQFTLRLVLAYQNSRYGNHVVAYHKVEDTWICCSDLEITRVSSLPTDNVYGVVYES